MVFMCNNFQEIKVKAVLQYLATNETHFNDDWKALQDWRLNWRHMLKSCERRIFWSDRDVESDLRTDAARSYITRMDLKKAGVFSRFWIQSVDVKGRPKSIGGDAWTVYIREGPTSVVPMVVDLNSGLYEVIMLIMEPGVYKASIYLDYTLCDGLREPPLNWFINGTDYGTYIKPQSGYLGNIAKDYIRLPLRNQTKHTFRISRSCDNCQGNKRSITTNTLPCFIWDGNGYWQGQSWIPYKSEENSHSDLSNQQKRSGTLWVYGDSLGMRFIESLRTNALCTEIFSKCTYTYNWIYEVKDKRHPLKIKSTFDKTVILNKIRQILQQDEVNQSNSMFVLSLGVHFPISLSFQEYRDLVDSVILLIKQLRNGMFKGHVVWKSTASFEREKINRKPWPARPFNYTMFRFLTPQRNQLFHAYSIRAMCQAGIPVLDVYPLTASYHSGTLDYVHYNDSVFYPAARALERFVIRQRGNIERS